MSLLSRCVVGCCALVVVRCHLLLWLMSVFVLCCLLFGDCCSGMRFVGVSFCFCVVVCCAGTCCAFVGFVVWRYLLGGVYRCRPVLSVVGCLLIVVVCFCCNCSSLFGVCGGVLLFAVS